MISSSTTETESSRVQQGTATSRTAIVPGARRRAAEAATRTAQGGTSRSQLQRTTLPNSKSRPTPQPMQTSVIKNSPQASPADIHQAQDKAPIRQATRFWLDRREMLWRKQHATPGSYEEFLASTKVDTITSGTQKTRGTKGSCIACT